MRWGVLGTGYWAEETHAAAIAAAAGEEFIGVWGRDRTKADRIAARWGGRGYADPPSLFADVDAVAFALPPDVQARLAVQAAHAGRHLLLEKPIALDSLGSISVREAVESSGVASVVFFTLRFRVLVRPWLSEAIATNGWQGASGRWLAGGTFDSGSPWEPSSWRRIHGALWDLTPHLLSVVVPVLGPVQAVTADRGPTDLVHLLLTHESGASSSLSVAQTLAPRVAATDLELYGEAGRSAMPDDTETTAIAAFQAAMRELADSVRSGQPSPTDVRLGAHVVSVIEAAKRSLDSAESHRIPVDSWLAG
jgi:predicted dehydrogenase